MKNKIEITGKLNPEFEAILTDNAKNFLIALHEQFNHRRLELLNKRQEIQAEINRTGKLDILPETAEVRNADWQVAPAPEDLNKRWVEITGPPNRKMTINALNSGSNVFMADFEDANSPTWYNCIEGQISMRDFYQKKLAYHDEKTGKSYELRTDAPLATLVIRPRGWHLNEKNILINGEISSGSLTDFGLAFFHNAKQALQNGTGPYYYLPKMESYLEVRLWNDIFTFAQKELGIPYGTIRATMLIETIPAAFQMEEFLFELKDHAAGLNAGRWDYTFSCTKRFKKVAALFPDRDYITMTSPFMRAYTQRLVMSCHKRGAHAVGGMSAFIPNRRDPEVTERALKIVRDDKAREAGEGFDGSWVAHPDLVELCAEEFRKVIGDNPHQKSRQRPEVEKEFPVSKLIDFEIPGGKITKGGFYKNLEVGMLYLTYWFLGNGAYAINNRMEDVATAEITRTLTWQWLQKEAKFDDGTPITEEYYRKISAEVAEKHRDKAPEAYDKAQKILDDLILNDDFEEFLSVPAYEILE